MVEPLDTDALEALGLPDALIGRLTRWRAADLDPQTVAELDRLIAAGDRAGLEDRFARSLRVGTSGLRGQLGVGPNRMNRLVVRLATVGLLQHLPDRPRVVIGRDARAGSAELAAEVESGVRDAGGEAVCFPDPVPTPLVAFAVRRLGADAGVVITASHNPPQDNGYKAYLADGVQVGPPDDQSITAAVAADPPCTDVGPNLVTPASPARRPPVPDLAVVRADYVAAAAAPAVSAVSAPRRIRIVTTALHGVAGAAVAEVLAAAGFGDVVPVTEQLTPDGSFPTLTSPNPEDPGVLDRAIRLAEECGADVVLGLDPDGDRLAVAVPGGRPGEGWQVLSGNAVGALLTEHLLAAGHGRDRLVVSTLVTTSLVEAVARHHGVHHVATPTGFKWVLRAAIQRQDLRFVIGVEEALGYAITTAVRDKDGISAAAAVAALVAGAKDSGRTVDELLEVLDRRHGVHRSRTLHLRLDDPCGADGSTDRLRGELCRRVEHLRTDPPERIGQELVSAVSDFTDPQVSAPYPPHDLLRFELAAGGRVGFRPSGTEPKLKCYLEVVEPSHIPGEAVQGAGAAELRLVALERAVTEMLGIHRSADPGQ